MTPLRRGLAISVLWNQSMEVLVLLGLQDVGYVFSQVWLEEQLAVPHGYGTVLLSEWQIDGICDSNDTRVGLLCGKNSLDYGCEGLFLAAEQVYLIYDDDSMWLALLGGFCKNLVDQSGQTLLVDLVTLIPLLWQLSEECLMELLVQFDPEAPHITVGHGIEQDWSELLSLLLHDSHHVVQRTRFASARVATQVH